MIRGWLGIVVACALLGLPAKAAAWCQMAVLHLPNNDTQTTDTCMDPGVTVRLHWTRKCLSYSVDDKGSTDPGLDLTTIEQVASKAFATWTNAVCPVGSGQYASPGFQVRETTDLSRCDQAQYNPSGGNVNSIAFLSGSDWLDRNLDGFNTTYALTTVFHDTDTGEILDADMLINEHMGPYTVCPDTGCPPSTSANSPVDLQNVMTHEAGHYFGLGHSQLALDPQNIDQWPTMTTAATRDATFMRTLAQDDLNGFCAIYPPPASPPACSTNADFLPAGGLRLDCAKGGGCSIGGAPGTGSHANLVWLIAIVAAALAIRRRRVS